jgi:hypothetical protein
MRLLPVSALNYGTAAEVVPACGFDTKLKRAAMTLLQWRVTIREPKVRNTMNRRAFLSATLLAGLTGCVVAAPPPGRPPIPVARYEPVPPPPGERVVWQPGEWHWDGHEYVWRAGHYVEKRVDYHRFVPGHWDDRGLWEPGHWV